MRNEPFGPTLFLGPTAVANMVVDWDVTDKSVASYRHDAAVLIGQIDPAVVGQALVG